MLNSMKTLALVTVFTAGIAAAPALYAHDSNSSVAPMMGPGMMGQGGMMDMMKMMGQMNKMMGTCNEMMQSVTDHHGSEGHDQKRGKEPMVPEKAE